MEQETPQALSSESAGLIESESKEELAGKTLAYICFIVFGAATLLPWNAFITPFDYWTIECQYGDNFMFLMCSISISVMC
ncbi:hypothetical protein KIPB_002118 [Kipferlia bialata]|uniref:Equilibrative nucleoside transporter n=1 Tax=Kipferlia bialata TaxID=797122 RepID=A0A9K3CPP2_9EUKA|nr:hypothetical protein KIPB_002118 [Kipferlia bialata]|eukprot:g2118.t1